MSNVTATIRKALKQLRSERARLDRQIAALEEAFATLARGLATP